MDEQIGSLTRDEILNTSESRHESGSWRGRVYWLRSPSALEYSRAEILSYANVDMDDPEKKAQAYLEFQCRSIACCLVDDPVKDNLLFMTTKGSDDWESLKNIEAGLLKELFQHVSQLVGVEEGEIENAEKN
jgi:hypothetical protein